MTNVLKLAEEALEDLLPPVTYKLLSEPEQRGYAAIEAIRAARAEWSWEELQFTPTKWEGAGASIGKWENGNWMVVHGITFASTAHEMGFTHFCIPQLPPPPAREEVGNG